MIFRRKMRSLSARCRTITILSFITSMPSILSFRRNTKRLRLRYTTKEAISVGSAKKQRRKRLRPSYSGKKYYLLRIG